MQTKLIKGKEYVFCEWRRRFVRYTPEEYVRQLFLHRLVEEYAYPRQLIAVEQPLPNLTEQAAGGRKRADAIVYDSSLRPRMIIEFKADTVALSQRTLDQAATYNRLLHVPYLILNNGYQTIVAHVAEDALRIAQSIPQYGDLINAE